jgi:hypothetical protein
MAALLNYENGPCTEADVSKSRQIIIVDGGDRIVCDATEEASIWELWVLEDKIDVLLEKEDELGEIAHSVADNCAQLAWVEACQNLEQAR